MSTEDADHTEFLMPPAISEMMTRNLTTCPTDTNLVDAAKAMRDDGVGDVIVVDGGGTMTGIVTDRDITIRAIAEQRDPASTTVDEIASHDIATLGPNGDVDEAKRIMRERAIRRLPITEGGKPVGIISIGDLSVVDEVDEVVSDISAKPSND